VETLIPGLTAALIAFVWGALSIRLGPRWGFVDLPDGDLKTHQIPAVPLGGVGIFLGLHLGLATAGRFLLVFFAGTLTLLMLGLVDDRQGLAPVTRLLLTATAGGVLAIGERDLFWGVALAVVVVVLVNAVNLFDGLDALAGSTTTLSLLGIGWLASNRGRGGLVAFTAALAVVGFLFWNRPRARVFLGDNGAYLVGGTLAYLAIRISNTVPQALVAAALIGAPLFDLAVTVLRRYRAGAALFAGDRDHIYDRMLGAWSPGRVSGTLAVVQAVWVVLVVWLESTFGPGSAATIAASVGLVAALVLARR